MVNEIEMVRGGLFVLHCFVRGRKKPNFTFINPSDNYGKLIKSSVEECCGRNQGDYWKLTYYYSENNRDYKDKVLNSGKCNDQKAIANMLKDVCPTSII